MSDAGRDLAEDVRDWDAVYGLWATDGQQSDYTTADLTGIPRRTISWHRTRERWQQRFVQEHMGLSEHAVGVARIKWRNLLQLGAERMEYIITAKEPARDMTGRIITDDDGNAVMTYAASHKDAVAAYRMLVEAVVMRDQENMVGSQFIDIVPTAITNGHEKPDPATLATAILEEHAQSVNTRVLARSRRGKRV